MKEFLVGDDNESGAHKRYHPNDLSAIHCRKILADAQKPNSKNTAVKVRHFRLQSMKTLSKLLHNFVTLVSSYLFTQTFDT